MLLHFVTIDTFITRVFWMIELKYLSRGKVPVMAFHGSANIFYYHRKRENICVEDEKILGINVDCVS